jgi:hypothetical protein
MEAAVQQLLTRGLVTLDEVRSRIPEVAAALERQAVTR